MSASTSTVRGCTKISTDSDQERSRRSKPSGSAFTERAGPMVITARRRVGTVNICSWFFPAPSGGTRKDAAPLPTGSSTTVLVRPRRP